MFLLFCNFSSFLYVVIVSVSHLVLEQSVGNEVDNSIRMLIKTKFATRLIIFSFYVWSRLAYGSVKLGFGVKENNWTQLILDSRKKCCLFQLIFNYRKKFFYFFTVWLFICWHSCLSWFIQLTWILSGWLSQ
jgi:hypothetical protein